MPDEPTAILLNDKSYQGQSPAQLTHSNQQLDDFNLANAQDMTIQGPAGAIVTFFDDCQFKTDQNHLMIIKSDSTDVRLNIATDLGPDIGQQVGDRVYQGQADTYEWYLFKVVEASIFQDIFGAIANWIGKIPFIGAELSDIFLSVEQNVLSLLATYLKVASVAWSETPIGAAIFKYVDLGALNGTSSNFHVDNVKHSLRGWQWG